MISDERIKEQYINEKRLAVVTRLMCAMIRPPDDPTCLNEDMIIEVAYELAIKILDKESDLQVTYQKWLRDQQQDEAAVTGKRNQPFQR